MLSAFDQLLSGVSLSKPESGDANKSRKTKTTKFGSQTGYNLFACDAQGEFIMMDLGKSNTQPVSVVPLVVSQTSKV